MNSATSTFRKPMLVSAESMCVHLPVGVAKGLLISRLVSPSTTFWQRCVTRPRRTSATRTICFMPRRSVTESTVTLTFASRQLACTLIIWRCRLAWWFATTCTTMAYLTLCERLELSRSTAERRSLPKRSRCSRATNGTRVL